MPTVHQRYGQTDGRTDGRTTYDSNTALTLCASRGKQFALVTITENTQGHGLFCHSTDRPIMTSFNVQYTLWS